MACRLDQKRISREELTGVTTFAAIGDVHVLRGKKRRRGKSPRVGIGVAYAALTQRWNMIELLADGPSRNIIGIAIVATLTIVSDTRVKEGLRWLKRIAGGVANDAILGCRNVTSRFSSRDATVVTRQAIIENARMVKNCPAKGSCT